MNPTGRNRFLGMSINNNIACTTFMTECECAIHRFGNLHGNEAKNNILVSVK